MSKKPQPAQIAPKGKKPPEPPAAAGRSKAPVILLIVAIFLGLIVVKLVSDSAVPTTSSTGEVGTSITSVHNDAVSDYDAAVASGKPIYLLFHSLTCEPCVEISAVADQVMPEYADKVVFVNAITDDPTGQELSASFAFQYIPTSFFLAPGATDIVDSYVGAMDATAMRTFLDALIEAQ